MKIINCKKCGDSMVLVNKMTRTCYCGAVGGKYLDDNVTAVVNQDAIVYGIDNNGFNVARHLATHDDAQNLSHRVDYFFTGWIPNHPGEVLVVEDVEDVLAYPYELPDELKEYSSTLPTEIAEKNENDANCQKTDKKRSLKHNNGFWNFRRVFRNFLN